MKHRILSLLIAGCTAVAGVASASIGIYSQAEENSTDTVRILAVGDSITDGYINGDNGYRKYFCYDLQQAGITNFDMVGPKNNWTNEATYNYNGTTITYDPAHAGYSGYTIQNIGSRSGIQETIFDTTYTDYETSNSGNMLEAYDPDIVMLQIGTNDILDAQNDGIADRLEELVDKILPYVSDEGEMLFLASIPDIDVSIRYDWLWAYGMNYSSNPTAFTETVQNAVDSYNAAVKALVEEKQAEGQHIQFADIHSVVDMSTGLYDGVHPNESGYACMGKYWSELISAYLNDTPLTTTTPAETTTTAPETTTTSETTEATTTTESTSTELVTTTVTAATTEESTVTTSESTVETTTQTETTAETSDSEDTTASATESTTTTTIPAPTQLGDVNEDGSISVADVVALSRYLVQDLSLTYDAYLQADLNQDQMLNALDLSLLRQLILSYQSAV